MRTCCLALMLLVFLITGAAAQKGKPILVVAKDGFPTGHATPEGAACDLARAFIQRDANLFRNTCVKPFGAGENRKRYETFLKQMADAMRAETKKATPSPEGPKALRKVFAARSLSKNGPVSYAYAVLNLKDVKFVDVGAILQSGKPFLNRTLVVQDATGKWYVHPFPTSAPMLSDGLNSEPASTRDFSEAYTIKH